MKFDSNETRLETERLILRQWKNSDTSPFIRLNECKETMKYFPKTPSAGESQAFIDKTIQIIKGKGYGLFAVERKEDKAFLGFIGLNDPTFKTNFTPCTEIGWRLYKDFWGYGYATEGAKAVLNFAKDTLRKEEIVSFTSHLNIPSIKVMERIGMVRDLEGDFEHPNVEQGHPLRPHCLYRITFK